MKWEPSKLVGSNGVRIDIQDGGRFREFQNVAAGSGAAGSGAAALALDIDRSIATSSPAVVMKPRPGEFPRTQA